jgi:hypothetical protein
MGVMVVTVMVWMGSRMRIFEVEGGLPGFGFAGLGRSEWW